MPVLDPIPQSLTVQSAIETRRSIRQYHPDMPRSHLLEILRLATLAPSAFNAQPWRFAVVENPELKEQLKAVSYNQSQITSAPYTIVVYSDAEDTLKTAVETSHPHFGEEGKVRQVQSIEKSLSKLSVQERARWGDTQANIVLGILMVAARGLGYDTVPMMGFDQTKVKQLLGLPDHVIITALLPIGRAAELGRPHHRHSLERVTRFY
ncbi:nitroreductase family protein [Deinococcus cellulosilyticus]|uniref:Nitroreductase n=1 Tax=Deinococcus cellulosilyticus (strain DSM 18568 / NBRC 106333 / KACC 11606 / 5516J-15) TaxID=1223518 RepID=A0A511NBH5_DEIC1|nr:nitroreductase family protein [Deinococcus cellulosilyticus]GEM50179.1 nitroreductase [Deinococcus cellulosilyticus NBRC 106333 = KACC 11606]